MQLSTENLQIFSPQEKRELLAKLLQERANQKNKEFPLSYGQKALWFIYQLDPKNVAYNIMYAGKLCQDVDLELLKQSFDYLVQRHPALRTIYTIKNNQPIQQVQSDYSLAYKVTDGSNWTDKDIQRWIDEQADKPFILEKNVFRVNLLTFRETANKLPILHLTIHHITSEFWSFEILLNELQIVYDAMRQNKKPDLQLISKTYRDFVQQETKKLAGSEVEKLWNYWKDKLYGELPVINLPTDFPRPPVQTYQGKSYNFELDKDLSYQLRELAKSQGVTLYTLMLTAFQVLLLRYCNQEDILIGTPLVNRNLSEFEKVIGYFVNMVVMRGDLSGKPSFLELLSRVKTTVLEGLEHQDYPFSLLVDKLKIERDASRSPLFQVSFVWDKARNNQSENKESRLVVETIKSEQRGADFDLNLSIFETGDTLTGSWGFRTDLFAESTIVRFTNHFRVLLKGILENPEEKVSKLPLLTKAEKHQILVEWNDTQADYPKEKCIHQLFEEQVLKTPEAVALVYEDQQLTYQELNQKANQLGHYLVKQGVTPDSLVGICVERSLEMIVGLLGILKAGGAYVPIDPNYPQERIEYMLEDSGVSVLLTQERLIEVLPESESQVISLDDWELIGNESEGNVSSRVSSESLAYVIYTSGSTGKPKGVMIEHQGVINLAQAQVTLLNVHSNSRILQFASFSFDACAWETVMALLYGATLVLVAKDNLLPGDNLETTLNQYNITHVTLPPTALTIMSPESLSEVETIIVAGEACPSELASIWSQGRNFFNGYGPTESTVCATIGQYREDLEKLPIGKPLPNIQVYILDAELQPVPIGVAGELHIGGDGLARGYLNRPDLTTEKFITNPFDITGQTRLYKTGDLCRYLSDGNIEYIGRIDHQVKIRGFRIELREIESLLNTHPDIRECVVIAKENQNGDKRLIAYIISHLMPDRLHYVKTCQLEINGRIYTVKSEDLSLEGIGLKDIPLDLSVGTLIRLSFPLPNQKDSIWLSGEIAWYEDGQAGIKWDFTPEERERVRQSYQWLQDELGILNTLQRSLSRGLRQYLQEKLLDYMIPSAFILLEKLPLTPNGKIDRKALPAPDGRSHTHAQEFVAPQTPTQEILANIWQDVLKIDSISIKDNFFERGGHSLLATQIVSRIREAFSVELPVRILFEKPILEQLAQQIEQTQKQAISSITPVSREQNLPLSFAQQRLWFLDQLEGASATYNIPAVLEIKGQVNQQALEESLNYIIQRHESLRTRFVTIDGNAIQQIDPERPIKLKVINLETFENKEKNTKAQEIALQEAQKPFNLSQDPLIRASLIQLETENYLLLLTLHHIISDGWSMGILIQELSAGYSAYTQGKDPNLEPLTIQYADYAAWQRNWLKSEFLQKQLNYWKQKLSDLPPLLELPTDYPRPPIQRFEGAHQSFILPLELSQAIKQLSQKAGVTLFMTLLTAFSILLSRYSRQEDIAIGSPIANRNRSEIESLIGFFVNTLVMRINLENNPTVMQLLTQVRKTCLDAYANQHIPFEKLVEEIKPERNLSHTPLFQVMFALQNAPLELTLPDLMLSLREVESGIAKFDLTLSMEETEQGIKGTWEYNTDLFSHETMMRMIGHFQFLLEGIVKNPAKNIQKLPFLTKPEKQQILVEWNKTETDYPNDKCIHQLFEEQVEKNPDAVAILYQNQSLTYRDLNQKANQLGHYLQQKLGIKPDNLVGISVEPCLEMIIGLLGILKAGAAYVPIDPNYPKDRIIYQLKDANIPILLTQEKWMSILPQTQARLICLDNDWSKIAQEASTKIDSGVTSDNLAYVIYTSGSTGRPKGVMIRHQGVGNLAQAQIQRFQVTTTSRVLQFASFSFDASLSEILMALLSGATLCLVSRDELLPGETLEKTLNDYAITHITLPPSALTVMSPDKLLGLETIIVAGEACSSEIAEIWSKSWNFFNGYGPTEDTVCATIGEYQEDLEKFPIGKPISNTQVYILDNSLQPVPIGIAGELHISGVGLAKGYLNRPELTKERFINNPFDLTGKSKLYKTGDLCRYLPDGNIEYIGRIDDQVKVRGFRIELGEIESVLSEYSDVQEGVVIAPEDTSGSRQLVAYVVWNPTADRIPYQTNCLIEIEEQQVTARTEDIGLNGVGLTDCSCSVEVDQMISLRLSLPDQTQESHLLGQVVWQEGNRIGVKLQLSSAEQKIFQESLEGFAQKMGFDKVAQRIRTESLRNYLKRKLPSYMMPSRLILLPDLPRTPNGKVDRKALSKIKANQAELSAAGVQPQTEMEKLIAVIWLELLGLETIGIHDNFFDLGGHSLLMAQMQHKLQSLLNRTVSVVELFQYPTIHTLATYLSQQQSSASSSSPQEITKQERSQSSQTSRKRRRELRRKHRSNP